MKMTIDTTNKTLTVEGSVDIVELLKFIKDFKLEEYKLVQLNTNKTQYVPYYPPSPPYWDMNPTCYIGIDPYTNEIN